MPEMESLQGERSAFYACLCKKADKCMAVASSRAGQVLAQPLFRRLNVHVRTLKTQEVVRIRTSKLSSLGKRLPNIVQISLTKGNVALGFSVISVYSMAIPYCDEAHGLAACGIRAQLSLYAESEITSLVSQAPSSFPSCAGSTYCQRWKGGQDPGNKTTHSVLNANQNPACQWSQLRSDLQANFFAAGECPPM